MGRRPQEYGSPIWCFVEIENGVPQKLLDFPLPKSRWRGCDTAWHLQMAMDHVRGEPQRYRLCSDSEGERIDFFFAAAAMGAETSDDHRPFIGTQKVPYIVLGS